MRDFEDIDVRGLDADARRRAHAAADLLRAVSVGDDPRAIFAALRSCAPVEGGLIGVMAPATSESLVGHVVALPGDVMAAWATTPRQQLEQMMAPLVPAGPGELISDRQAIAGPFRDQLSLLRALEAANLGESAGYKVAADVSLSGHSEHRFLTLALDRGEVFAPVQRELFRRIHPALEAALARMAVPLVARESILRQVVEDSQIGCLCFSRSGALVEFNERACELAIRYAVDARVELGRDWIAQFAERIAAQTANGRPWRLRRDDRCARMEITTHRLAKASHAIVDDLTLVMMRESEIALPDVGLSPCRRLVAELLVTTGLSIKEIAHRLNRSEGTVRKHAEAVRRAYGVQSRDELRDLLR